MSSNVGLSTPRGSGTSGYVQRNLSVLKPRAFGAGAPYAPQDTRGPPRHRKPDEEILKHDRMREVEVKVLELRDKLEDEGKLDDDAIDEECDLLRQKLQDADKRNIAQGGTKGRQGIKRYQVHELAEAKIQESDRLRKALGLKHGGAEVDDMEHPMARQERQKRQREMDRAKIDMDREEELQRTTSLEHSRDSP